MGVTVAGRRPESNDDVRRLLLEEAGFAVVPFQAFGVEGEDGWCRLSVGAASVGRHRRPGSQRLERQTGSQARACGKLETHCGPGPKEAVRACMASSCAARYFCACPSWAAAVP